MTPDELNRAIEFLVEQQAHLIARSDAFVEKFDAFVGRFDAFVGKCDAFTGRFDKFLQKSERQHEAVADAITKLTAVAEIQSNRLDRHDEFLRETRLWQQAYEDEAKVRHREIIVRLDHIVDKLSDRKN